MTSTPAPRRHMLLVGIDAYKRVSPLSGCVNDIDAIEAFLLNRMGVHEDAILKLTAPHTWNARSPRATEEYATSANLRAALESLADKKVEQGDRVLIWYCGHGTQILRSDARTPREALVPVDFGEGGALLYDFEINDILARIARRSNDLTVILDCCCSAGATRSVLRPQGSAVRFCRVEGLRQPEAEATPRYRSANPRGAAEATGGLFSSLDPSDPGYLVAASCQSNERAHEGPNGDGKTHGAFSGALLEALAALPSNHLEALRWVDIWQSVRAYVSARFPGQHPILLGRGERRLFGGPFQPHDAGYPVMREGSRFRIAGGIMAGLSDGARVAVYGAKPDFFPPLNSSEDFAARLGVLRVDSATPSSSTAVSVGPEVRLVDGARSRLIAPGRPDALVVGLDPYQEALAKSLADNQWMRVVPANRASNEIEEVYVGTDPNGTHWIGDDVYASRPGSDGEPPLVRVSAGDTMRLIECLMHYAKYNLPLRLARRCRDLPEALRVHVLDCWRLPPLSKEQLQDLLPPSVQTDPEHRYDYLVEHGQPVCVAVENDSSEHLYVTLMNCATSGRVEIIGTGQLEIPPGRRQTFWLYGNPGNPFRCHLPPGRSSGVDRLVAVATSVPNVDLSFLRESKSFEDVMHRRYRDMAPSEGEPRELWTARLVTIKIVRALAGSVQSP